MTKNVVPCFSNDTFGLIVMSAHMGSVLTWFFRIAFALPIEGAFLKLSGVALLQVVLSYSVFDRCWSTNLMKITGQKGIR